MMQVEHQASPGHLQSTRGETLRRFVTYAVMFAAGFAAALWLAVPPKSEAFGNDLGEIAGVEFGRDGLHIEPRSKDALLVVSTWSEGIPRSYPVPPGREPTRIPADEVEEGWGLYEIRFRPCRVGDCTDPVPPPDLFDQSGMVVWSPSGVREYLCRSCDEQKCCSNVE